jgi:hypothetical protein
MGWQSKLERAHTYYPFDLKPRRTRWNACALERSKCLAIAVQGLGLWSTRPASNEAIARLLELHGILYGTTFRGGTSDNGTAFGIALR